MTHNLARNTLLAAVFELAEKDGVSRNEILREIALDEPTALLPGLFVRSSQLVDAVEFAAHATGRKDFGLALSATRDHRMMGLIGLLIENCRSVREAITETIPYLRLHNTALRYTLHRRPNQYAFRLQVDTRSAYRPQQYVEALLSGCVRLCRLWLGEGWTPLAVTFEHSRIAPISAYQRVLGKQVVFDESMNAIVAKRNDFERRLPLPESLEKALVKQLLDDLVRTRAQPLAPRIAGLLRATIPAGQATADNIAKQVGMSRRTFQRRLEQEGTSFSEQMNAVRLQLLNDHISRLNLAELATLLGFSEPSVVSRFIKTNTRRSLKAWRKELRGRSRRRRKNPDIPQ